MLQGEQRQYAAQVWLKNCCTTTDKGLEVRRGQLIRSRKAQYRRDSQPRGSGIQKLLGAVLPMSEQAQLQLRDSIEVIDYLMNQRRRDLELRPLSHG